jgi:hypothetical protein
MNYNRVSKVLKEYNQKYFHLLNEDKKINFDKLESTTKNLINTSFDIDSKNFDRFEVDITPRYLGYGPDIHITAVFKGGFTGKESDAAQNLRWDIRHTIVKFIPTLSEFDFGFRVSTREIYRMSKIGYDELKKTKKITEELRSFNNSFLLAEASKKKILVDKLGLSETNAEYLDNKCGSLSVWMFNKLLDLIIEQRLRSSAPETATKEYIIKERFNTSPNYLQINYNSVITSIMDWIRVGLNGNLGEYKNLSLVELRDKSQEWHNSLKVSGGEINYTEPHTHDILIDNRDENGFGFYWVDLNTHDSNEECRRMGHCGRTGRYNTIWSLRENKIYPGNPKYTINISHLTAAIGSDGILYQLKGPSNSKPKEEYNELILPIFYILGGGGEEEDYLIKGFGSEYASERDFKLTDLPNEVIAKLYQDRPELFKSYSLRKKLRELGLVDVPEIDYVIEYEVGADDVDRLVDGDWTVRQRKRKTPAGSEYTVKIGIFETILSGDMWGLWDNWDADWKGALDYYVNKENEKKIWELVKGMAGEEFDEELDLEDAIEEYDGDHEIQNAISSAVSDAEASDYTDYLWKELKNALEEWGEVIKMDDTGVRVRIDTAKYIEDYIDYYGDESFEDAFERCNEDVECVFVEILDSIDKPKFSIDERWYPSIDRGYFNDTLADRLNEI